MVEKHDSESSETVAARVLAARQIQKVRFKSEECENPIFCNAAMNNRQIEKFCPLCKESKDLLERIIDKMGLSARACTRIIKLARTIADLAASDRILPEHIAEAASYRILDRHNF